MVASELAATPHGASSVAGDGRGVPAEPLAAQAWRVGRAVHLVVAAVYEHAMPSLRGETRHPLTDLIEATAPVLHQVRYVKELLPPA